MVLAYRFSEAQGVCPPGAADRIVSHLAACGMKAHPRDAGITADGATLVRHMAHDKKMESGKLPFLLARGLGKAFLARDVSLGDVERFLDRIMAERCTAGPAWAGHLDLVPTGRTEARRVGKRGG